MPPDTLASTVQGYFALAGGDPHVVDGLTRCLLALDGAATLTARLDAWVALIDWARAGRQAGDKDANGMLARTAVARWELLFDFLDANPAVRRRMQATLAELLSEAEGTNLFGTAGLPGGRGFLAEFGDRLMRELLPQPADEHDLARLLHRLYRTRAQVERFIRLPAATFERLAELLLAPDYPDAWRAVSHDFADGFRLLATRVQAEGLAPSMRARTAPASVASSPFLLLQRASELLLEAWLAGREPAQEAAAWREHAGGCRERMQQIARRTDTEGVSVDIVYGLEALDRCLTRMELMVMAMEAPAGAQRHAALHQLLSLLIAANHNGRSVRHLIADNLQLLQRKIVEHAGKTGEHYIAWTRKEYWHIWAAAAGGGLLTVLTAAFKTQIVALGAPLFVEGLLAGLNYAVSFLLLQHLGLILATKQPAMTAAALAGILRTRKGAERLDEVAGYAARIVRSQLAATLSNVIVVSLGAYAFSFLWQLALGRAFLDHHEAQHVVETLSPVDSLTVWYAALTGAILWAASVIGGWFDNWAVYRRLPQAIAEHSLGRRLGRQKMARLAGLVSRNIAGWGTNVSLGMMLGLTPVVGVFLGLPLDVRHVTLSTGTLALATAELGGDWYHHAWFLWALTGIATMFVLNLGVSFLLSLYTAARAFGLPRGFLLEFGRALGRCFLRTPGTFLLPPRATDGAPHA